MISVHDCAQACFDLYYNPDAKWDVMLYPAADKGICMAIKSIGGVHLLVYRGSVTEHDWWCDGISEFTRTMPPPFHNLGHVALGFSDAMAYHFEMVRPYLQGKKWGVTGHSLGGARAKLMAGMGTVCGMPPLFVNTFGQPRVGFQQFCNVTRVLPGVIVKNRNDLVTDLPTCPPFMDDREWTAIDVPPPAHDEWGIFADHHMNLYLEGTKNLGG